MSQRKLSGSNSQNYLNNGGTNSIADSLPSTNPYSYTLSQQERNLILERDRNTVNQLAQDMIILAQSTNSSGANLKASSRSSAGAGSVPLSASNSATRVMTEAKANTLLGNLIAAATSTASPQPSNNYSSNFNNNNSTKSTNGGVQLSEIESAILRSTMPLDMNETEEITVNGERGILLNKNEIANWRGIPLSQYAINDDPNPEIIRKQTDQKLTYHQEVAIRYLRPPTPPAPGEIIIQQEGNSFIPPAPPLVIRQQPPRPTTPPPLVVREAPPPPPPPIGRKVITISGKSIPPPPRKVIIERLPPLPTKPQSVIIERWLPYKQIKRKVIYSRANNSDAVMVKPKNVGFYLYFQDLVLNYMENKIYQCINKNIIVIGQNFHIKLII
jgi:hypothetical protein